MGGKNTLLMGSTGLFCACAVLLTNATSFAQTYHIDFEPQTRLVPPSGEITIKMKSVIEDPNEDSWKIKPLSTSSGVAIKNTDTGEWVYENTLWEKAPALEDKHSLKIHTFGKTADISLQIKNLRSGETYQTPLKKFWMLESYGDYYKRTEDSIKEWKRNEETRVLNQDDRNDEEEALSGQTAPVRPAWGGKTWAIIHLASFVMAGGVGLTKKDAKIPLCENTQDLYPPES
jgi:hypothetical protein